MKKHSVLRGVIGDIAVLIVGYLMFDKVKYSISNNNYDFNFYLFLLAFVIIIAYILYRITFILKNKNIHMQKLPLQK